MEPISEQETSRSDLAVYLNQSLTVPLFICGDALSVLHKFPSESIDCCMTSPPYWGKRQYAVEGIGLEADYRDYIAKLAAIFAEVRRILKTTGSFWLNMGDSYHKKSLLGLPWRMAFTLTDQQSWILRNSVVWNKVKGSPDNAEDKLRNVHEYVFHFVKQSSGYFYDVDAIRNAPRKVRIVNGAVVSATGVRGVRYKRQIELSTQLDPEEKQAALAALEEVLGEVKQGKISDFRMIIQGQQRTTHSDSETVSGRAKELHTRGFYFLKYHPSGTKPGDVWEILPEDTQQRQHHFAPYPEDLCRIPILATCPKEGIVLDPFCGTGTTMVVAQKLGRRSVGIDISDKYSELAKVRCGSLL
jgi:site-specific DNA-methyltransferase (adenine-specific)